MSIQELGSLGEFLGFFAVLITLIYLAVQTKRSKNVAITQGIRDMVAGFQSVWGLLSTEAEFARIVRLAVNDWNSVSNNEKMQVHSFFGNLFVHYGSSLSQEYHPEAKSVIAQWENNLLGLLCCPGGREWYDICRVAFDPEIVRRLDARLADEATLPASWISAFPWWVLDDGDKAHGAAQ